MSFLRWSAVAGSHLLAIMSSLKEWVGGTMEEGEEMRDGLNGSSEVSVRRIVW